MTTMTTPTQSPKVVVIGAGSLFFGRQAIWQMVHSPHLNNGTLALVDTDPQRPHPPAPGHAHRPDHQFDCRCRRHYSRVVGGGAGGAARVLV